MQTLFYMAMPPTKLLAPSSHPHVMVLVFVAF